MISQRERLISIAAAGVLGLLALDQIIYTPLATRLDDADMRLRTANTEITEAQGLFGLDLSARRAWKSMAGATLLDNAPAAESQILNRVREWEQSAGLSVTSVKPQHVGEEQGYQKINVQMTATGNLQQVSRFLYAVQTATIPVRVSQMDITSRREGADELAMELSLATKPKAR